MASLLMQSSTFALSMERHFLIQQSQFPNTLNLHLWRLLSNKFHQEVLTIIMVLVIINALIALNLEKFGPTFQVSLHGHPCVPLQQTTGDRFNS